jgi:hypothetical protein
MTRLIGLYPQTWRDRYEDEFLALLAERPPDPLDRLDIVRGAIDARLHPAPVEPAPTPVGDGPDGRLDNRGLGWLTLLGVPVWFAALVVALNGPIVTDSWGTYRDGMAAHPLAFIAIGLLLVGMAAAAAELPAGSRARTPVVIGALAGLLWAFAPWFIPAAAILCIGLVILGIASWRAERWHGADAALLVGGMILAWVPLFVIPLRLLDDYVTFFVFFAATWLAIGHALLRPARRALSAPDVARPA